MRVISITTDFGTRDGFVGVMKGVILGIAPEAKIVDISHDISPQNVREAAVILARQVFYFPENSIHIAVIDPGVGTQRRPIAAQIGNQFVVGPDNGLFTPLYEKAEAEGWLVKIVHTNKPEFWLSRISNVFHGRDIFSPVGAHLAVGVGLDELGEIITDPVRMSWPKPERSKRGCVGEVAHIDHFGNIISNIHRKDMSGLDDDLSKVNVSTTGIKLEGMVRTFGEGELGDMVALYSSNDFLAVSEVNGNAAVRFQVKVGDPFRAQIND